VALILERLEGRRADAAGRLQLDRLPLTIGRALDNDLVLDDPHVDAHHARIVADADGSVVLEDLGSVNGTSVVGRGREPRIALTAGTTLRLGRTALRVRDRAEAVAPAVPLAAFAPPGGWMYDLRWQLALVAIVIADSAYSAWIATTSRSGMTETLGIVVAVVIFLALWAAAWALVGKLVVRRAAFLTHMAIACASILVISVAELISGWGVFLFPSVSRFFTSTAGAVSIVVTCALLATHLAVSTALSSRKRWVGVLSVVGGIALLVGAFAMVKDNPFTDIPVFRYEIKRLPAAVIPAGDIDDFRAAVVSIRGKVDSIKARFEADSTEH
jgi:pSer/pThr/pTyr-binding forkhead associated (FHA) protein